MRLVRADAGKVKTYTATKLDAVIDEFIGMDADVVEIQDWGSNYKSVNACVCAINKAFTRRSERKYKAVIRKGVPYIAKREVLGY